MIFIFEHIFTCKQVVPLIKLYLGTVVLPLKYYFMCEAEAWIRRLKQASESTSENDTITPCFIVNECPAVLHIPKMDIGSLMCLQATACS